MLKSFYLIFFVFILNIFTRTNNRKNIKNKYMNKKGIEGIHPKTTLEIKARNKGVTKQFRKKKKYFFNLCINLFF